MHAKAVAAAWLWLGASAAWADLGPGDALPDCSKVPLIGLQQEYRPRPGEPSSLEDYLLGDGIVVVHFCTPRPARGGPFQTFFNEELAALAKAAQSVPYPCAPVAVVPFGEKGREDARTLLGRGGGGDSRVWATQVPLFFEPTYPRPGLYRTFRPDAADGDVACPLTFLIGPDRKILAVRRANEGGQLYDWLQQNLPREVEPLPQEPSSELSVPVPDVWTWPAFRRTPGRRAETERLPDTLPYTYLAWRHWVGRTFASPAVAERLVYVATDQDGLKALDLEQGEELASCDLGSAWWSSPAVAGETVYAVADGAVQALDRTTLEERWRTDLGVLATSSPVVTDGALYVGARDGAVYAVDAATGAWLWRFQTGGEVSSSAAVAGGRVLIGSGDRRLYALETRTGHEVWSAATGGAVDSSPVVAGDEVLVGSFDGGLYSFELGSGKLRWRCELGGLVHASPAVTDDLVYAATVRARRDQVPIFAWVDRRSGEVRGRFELPDSVYSSPTVWAEQVLVGCRDHQLYAFDRAMGQTAPLWTYRTGSYVHASPVVVGDTVLAASYDGYLYALRQAKPIAVWGEDDVVPRWFVAAMARQLHREAGELVARAAAGEVGQELSLTSFDELLRGVRAEVAGGGETPPVLPRDVPQGHPGAPFIGYALTAGLLGGYPDGTFRPSEPTSRYQFAAGLAAVMESVVRPDFVWHALQGKAGAGVAVEVQARPLAARRRVMAGDVDESHWAYRSLAQLAKQGLLPVDDEGRFRGERVVTLRDAAAQWGLLVESIRVVRIR